jgi:hypothetical protein
MHHPHIPRTPEDEHIALPLGHNGFEQSRMTSGTALAAQMSAAALTQLAIQNGPDEYL